MEPYPIRGSEIDFYNAPGHFPPSKTTGMPVVEGNRLRWEKLPGQYFKMIGTNLTDWGCWPALEYVDSIAKKLRSKGYNTIRLHHIDRAIGEGWTTLEAIGAFIKALDNVNIRVTLDLYSKGREHDWGSSPFKLALLEGNAQALSLYENYIQTLLNTPVEALGGKTFATYPSVIMITLINEGAHLLFHLPAAEAVAKIQAFHDRILPIVRGYGFKGLIADAADAMGYDFGLVPSHEKLDVTTCHFYGDHPDTGGGKWLETSRVSQGWQWGSVLWCAAATGKPMILQEHGVLPFISTRCIDGFFQACELAHDNFAGELSFTWATHHSHLLGQFTTVDWYAIVTDLPRTIADIATIALLHYDRDEESNIRTRDWAHTQQQRSYQYSYSSKYAQCSLDKDYGWLYIATHGTLETSAKGLLFVAADAHGANFDSNNVRMLQDVKEVQVTNKGELPQQPMLYGKEYTIPGPKVLLSAYSLDPYTGKKTAACVRNGNTIQPTSMITRTIMR